MLAGRLCLELNGKGKLSHKDNANLLMFSRYNVYHGNYLSFAC